MPPKRKAAAKPIVHDDDDEDEVLPKKKKVTAKSSNGKSVSNEKKKKTAKPIKEEAEEQNSETDATKPIVHDDDEDEVLPKKKKVTATSSNGKSVSNEKKKKTKKTAKQIKEEAEEQNSETDAAKPIVHDDDDEDEVLPKKKKVTATSSNGKSVSNEKKKKTKKTAKQIKEEAEEQNSETDVKTIVIKGKAPIDSFCVQKIGKAHVFCEEDDVWDAMLNQTNLQFNNNKYYLLQLLEDDVGKNYSVWLRWGRVGNKGQSKLHDCGGNLENAKKIFKQKFQDKTKNDWDERDAFEKVSGKYDLLKMDYNPTEVKDEVDAASLESKKSFQVPACTLDQRVQALIELICNVKAMEEAVLEMKYDAKKAPLGKLTMEQIKAGYLALKEIEELINNGSTGSALVQACNNFYTRIPHNFGMKVPPLIRNKTDIIEKLHLLEALGDIEIAMKMLNETSTVLENPVDGHYKHLDCTLTPIDKDSETVKVIKEYLQNSHEKTHNHYKMELEDVFECNKEAETKQFIKHKNRMLLWHGSRLTNFVGILKQGLRIAPPEAPVTGYMFGKGVYFADRSSKSANYCCTTKINNTGLLLLCEVSLGNVNELLQSDYNADQLPKGKNSVKGLGSIIPDPSKQFKMEDGTIVPYGKGYPAPNTDGLTLNYNEYIVYDTKRIKMRYLVKVKFVYK